MLRDHRKASAPSVRGELFEGLSEREAREISRIARSLLVEKGARVFVPGDPAETVFFLRSGRVKISRLSPKGKELVLDIVEPGEIFGELGVLSSTRRETAGVALEASSLVVLPRGDLNRLLRSGGELASTLTRLMAVRLERMECRLADLAFRDVPGRLARLLLRMSDRYGEPDPRGTRRRIPLSQQLMANLIGASREIVNLTLADFRRQGYVAIDGDDRRLVICQSEALERI